MTRIATTPDTLSDVMEFGCPVRVTPEGTAAYDSESKAPETLYHVETTDNTPGADVEGLYDGWTLLHGYTGQYSYNGVVMHASEYIGGRLAEDIMAKPGVYVALSVEVMDDDGQQSDEPAGWAIAFHA